MLISAIVKRVNELLAGETLSYRELIPHLDNAVDAINTQLNSIYPVFSELAADAVEYNLFPDKFIRTCICLGAACSFYKTDEEGGNAPMGYEMEYRYNLFIMLRDYVTQVPLEYEMDENAGRVPFDLHGTSYSGITQEAFKI